MSDMMTEWDRIGAFLASIDPKEVPPEYLLCIRFKLDDCDYVVFRDDIERFRSDPPRGAHSINHSVNWPKLIERTECEFDYIMARARAEMN